MSPHNARNSEDAAALLASTAAWLPGLEAVADRDMKLPRTAFNSGRAMRASASWDAKLESITRPSAPGAHFPKAPAAPRSSVADAALTTASKRPKRSTTADTSLAAARPEASAVSYSKGTHWPVSCREICSDNCSRALKPWPATATLAPEAAAFIATCLLSPLVAPVTSTTLPFKVANAAERRRLFRRRLTSAAQHATTTIGRNGGFKPGTSATLTDFLNDIIVGRRC
mmetsp:Transcript_106531/g.206316  ORF Transcript_106531/g.206316 Transcript_106531/m.206316 type:complete len:228 (+) Transcript_106531:240-923(+)